MARKRPAAVPHLYLPHPDPAVPTCVCGMPKANRVHSAEAIDKRKQRRTW